MQQIFDGLVEFDPEAHIVPALAVSWERLDPLTMRFHLRQNVRFHNGELFDSAAVVFTFARLLDPAAKFPGAGFLQSISHVTAVDASTVDIVTRVPDSLLLRRLAWSVFILPPRAALQPGFGTHPVGTGPFRFVSWQEEDGIYLEANASHWLSHPSMPTRLVFRFMPVKKQLQSLLDGKLDVMTELPGTATLKVTVNPRTKVLKKATFYTVSANFNTTRPPLDDLRVRQAMNHAINKAELIRYDLLGNGREIASLSMPGEVGHNPALKPYSYDPIRAQKLLQQAGIVLPLRLRTITKSQGLRAARIIATQLRRVGIQLEINQVTTDAEVLKDMSNRDIDMGIAGLPDAMGHSCFLQNIMLYSKSPFSLMKDAEYDRRLEAVMSELDPNRHERMARELDRYVHDQALSLFTYQQVRTCGMSRRIDFTPSSTGRLYLNRVRFGGHPGENAR
ncbi:MAG: ABC transporter substrate-binding protein [Elusimicrobia bacterium]|nr:ABC transporter substrate-binding protein [Elusimicrobiota bacterium]